MPNEDAIEILLVEDNPGDARLVRVALSETWDGRTVNMSHAETLAAGLAHLAQHPVDAILLDLTLPDSSGIETFHQLFTQAKKVPIILLTGMQDEELAQAVMRAGAQDYLIKGQVDGKILLRSIHYAIERKKSQDSLRASEERYRTLIEQASDGIFVADPDGKFIEVNSSGCAIIGYSRDELLGMKMSDIANNSRTTIMGTHTHEVASGKVALFEQVITRRDGSLIQVEISAKLLPDGRRQGILRDITSRKAAEAALNESNEFNQTLVKTLPFKMDIVDEQGNILYMNQNSTSDLQFHGRNILCWEFHKDDQQQCSNCPLKTPIEIGQTRTTQINGVLGGRIFDVTHTGMWYRGKKALLEVFHDITDRKKLEEKLQNSLLQLKFHDENSPLAVIEFDSDYKLIHYSTRAHEIFGWETDEVLGKHITELPWNHPGDQNALQNLPEKMWKQEVTSTEISAVNYRKDGSEINCEWYLSAMFDSKPPEGKLDSIQALVLDVTERNIAEQALRASEAFGQALLYNSPIGISVRSPQGALNTYNDAWRNIWGFTEQDIQSQKEFNYLLQYKDINLDYLRPFKEELNKIYSTGGSLHIREIKVPNPMPGSAEWVSQRFYSIMDEDGQVNRVVDLTEDITERKKAELALLRSNASLEQRIIDRTFELRSANVELEKAARMKDEFLASMSHELRTPLTGILGLSEALQMVSYGDLNEKQLKALKNIEASGRHLLSLINDILDLSKIEAGMFEMQFTSSGLDGICQASLQMVKGMANQKHQKVSLSINPSGMVIRTDPRRLKQMLVNLLGNSIKFTPDGGTIGIDVTGSEETRQVSITVWDNGIGIRTEDLPRLFKPFVQLDSSLSRQYAGTGLGLSLVKRLADMQGGKIEVTSVYGEGSRFTILLPWVEEEMQPVKFTRRVNDKMQRSLTIEQNDEDGARLTALLKMLGIKNQVILAARGSVELAAQVFPEVIFLREHMQGISGLDLLSQLKTDSRTHSIPVILITRPEEKEHALHAGADGVITEPYAQSELFTELRKITYQTHADLNTAAEDAKSSPFEKRKDILVMMADDNSVVVELISDYLKVNHFDVSAVNSGTDLLANLESMNPDILLLDIQMPGMSGLDVIRAVRANKAERISTLPIIAISALAMSGDREKCLTAGANEYMSKPIRLQELLDLINEFCPPSTRRGGFQTRP